MTQRPTSSGDQFSASTSGSGSGFETVDLGSTGGAATSGASYGSSYNQSSTSGTQGAVDQVKQTAGQFADQAQDKAGQVVDQARGVVASRVSDQKSRAAESLHNVAGALRQTSQQLQQQDQAGVTDYVDSAANQLERLSGYLQHTDVGDLLDDVERFARRQPSVFLGGAFVLGLTAARFLKSSRRSSRSNPLATRDTRTQVYGGYQGGTTNYGRGYTGSTNYGGSTSYGSGTTGGATYGSSGLGGTGTTGGLGTSGTTGTLGGTGTTSGLGSTGTTGSLGTTGTTGGLGTGSMGTSGTTTGSTTGLGTTGLAGASTTDRDVSGSRTVGGTEEL